MKLQSNLESAEDRMLRKKQGPDVNLDYELDSANLIFTQRSRLRLALGKTHSHLLRCWDCGGSWPLFHFPLCCYKVWDIIKNGFLVLSVLKYYIITQVIYIHCRKNTKHKAKSMN